jgi:hypothetical protein
MNQCLLVSMTAMAKSCGRIWQDGSFFGQYPRLLKAGLSPSRTFFIHTHLSESCAVNSMSHKQGRSLCSANQVFMFMMITLYYLFALAGTIAIVRAFDVATKQVRPVPS